MSALVLVSTAMTASNNVSGYEKTKASLVRLYTSENVTADVKVTLTEDGTELMTNSFKVNKENLSSNSGVAALAGNVSRLSDSQKKLVNVVFDMLTGDTKNYFTNNNGEVRLKLEKNQVPDIFQTLLSVVSEGAGKILEAAEITEITDATEEYFKTIADGFYGESESFVLPQIDLPPGMIAQANALKALENYAIESVYMWGRLDESNLLTSADLTLTMTGADTDGAPHVFKAVVHMTFNDMP